MPCLPVNEGKVNLEGIVFFQQIDVVGSRCAVVYFDYRFCTLLDFVHFWYYLVYVCSSLSCCTLTPSTCVNPANASRGKPIRGRENATCSFLPHLLLSPPQNECVRRYDYREATQEADPPILCIVGVDESLWRYWTMLHTRRRTELDNTPQGF